MIRKLYSTKRLVLRPLVPDHAVWYECYVNRPPAKNAFDRAPSKASACTKDKFAKVVARHRRVAKEDRVYIFAAFLKSTGEMIGAIDVAIICRPVYGLGNLGYQLDNRHWGKGYGQEMALKACEIAFRDLGLHRLEAAMDVKNRRSQKLARAIGMRSEGIRKKYLYEDGHWLDQRAYVMTPEMMDIRPASPNPEI